MLFFFFFFNRLHHTLKIPASWVKTDSDWKGVTQQWVLSGECTFLGSVVTTRLGVTDIKALSVPQLSGLGQTVL